MLSKTYPIFIYLYPDQNVDYLIERYFEEWIDAAEYSLLKALSDSKYREDVHLKVYVVYQDKTYLRLV